MTSLRSIISKLNIILGVFFATRQMFSPLVFLRLLLLAFPLSCAHAGQSGCVPTMAV